MSKPYRLHRGDCLDVLKGFEDGSFHSIACDPPYGLSDHSPDDVMACMRAWLAGEEYRPRAKGGFMGRSWDSWVPGPEVWREAYRVLKPGGYLVVFASTRTDDLMSMAIRLAGFRKHPAGVWMFGSGMPKGRNLSKQFDEEAGAEREVVGRKTGRAAAPINDIRSGQYCAAGDARVDCSAITAPATDEAKEWDGWFYGLAALKPGFEPWMMFQKPHEGRMTDNVRQHRTGALNIGACKVPLADDQDAADFANNHAVTERLPADRAGQKLGLHEGGWRQRVGEAEIPDGRFPANVIHDGSAEVAAMFPAAAGQQAAVTGEEPSGKMGAANCYAAMDRRHAASPRGDAGSAARFFTSCPAAEEDFEAADRVFYCGKVTSAERHAGLQHPGAQLKRGTTLRKVENTAFKGNTHPTLKPVALCRHILRLVTPPGGRTLDMFAGSGSMGVGAILDGFDYTGVELDEDEAGQPIGYIDIAEARCAHAWDRRQHETAQASLFGESAA